MINSEWCAHTAKPLSLSWAPSSNYVASGGLDGAICCFEPPKKSTFKLHTSITVHIVYLENCFVTLHMSPLVRIQKNLLTHIFMHAAACVCVGLCMCVCVCVCACTNECALTCVTMRFKRTMSLLLLPFSEMMLKTWYSKHHT